MELIKRKLGRPTTTPKHVILNIVKYVLQNDISYSQASKHFNNVSRSQIGRWVQKYHSEIADLNDIENMPTLSPREQHDDNCAAQNKALQKALEHCELKNCALETMIDLAEKTYKISIRKNFGTKQH